MNEGSNAPQDKDSLQELPLLHRLSLDAQAPNMVDIIFEGLEAGKETEEIKSQIRTAARKHIEQN